MSIPATEGRPERDKIEPRWIWWLGWARPGHSPVKDLPAGRAACCVRPIRRRMFEKERTKEADVGWFRSLVGKVRANSNLLGRRDF